MREIPESDWKVSRKLREVALERFCERVLREIDALTAGTATSYHERYLEVFKLVDRRDDELAHAFNNPRRSAALWQFAAIRSHGLSQMKNCRGSLPQPRRLFKSCLNRLTKRVILSAPNSSSSGRDASGAGWRRSTWR